jgi:hypothetical protein
MIKLQSSSPSSLLVHTVSVKFSYIFIANDACKETRMEVLLGVCLFGVIVCHLMVLHILWRQLIPKKRR